MKSNSQSKNTKIRKILIPIILVLLIAVGGFGYFNNWFQKDVTTAEAADTTYNTTKVKQGSITLSATGSGSLTASKEANLSFSTSGTVAAVNVQVSDTVKKGDVLAELSNSDQLQTSLNSARQDLTSAQKELETLKQNAAVNLANAQLAVSTAQKAVVDAKSAAVQGWMTRCDDDTIEAYYYKYMKAKDNLEALGDGGGNQDYYLKVIVPAKDTVASAYSTYKYCAGFTDYEITSSQATLSIAEATLKTALEDLEELTKNNGIDPIELATAENKINTAQLAVQGAQEDLDGAVMKAPFDGTILSVAGEAGESVGTSTFITIADLAHPEVEFSIDETDIDKVAVGEEAVLTFDAYPELTFKGTVTRINPLLETSNGYQVIKGLVQLDISDDANAPTLRKGLNATVELIQATAENVLLIPLQSLRDLGDGTYGVFLMGDDGQPKLTVVEIGLQDAASVEIKSGLKLGDVITTGILKSK